MHTQIHKHTHIDIHIHGHYMYMYKLIIYICIYTYYMKIFMMYHCICLVQLYNCIIIFHYIRLYILRDLEISDAKIIYSYKVINIDDCINIDVDNNKNIILINIQLWF